MSRKTRSGFDNDAAEKIWRDHLGNNAFVHHRNQCATCSASFEARKAGRSGTMCDEGDRLFDEMLEGVDAKIEEVTLNQN